VNFQALLLSELEPKLQGSVILTHLYVPKKKNKEQYNRNGHVVEYNTWEREKWSMKTRLIQQFGTISMIFVTIVFAPTNISQINNYRFHKILKLVKTSIFLFVLKLRSWSSAIPLNV